MVTATPLQHCIHVFHYMIFVKKALGVGQCYFHGVTFVHRINSELSPEVCEQVFEVADDMEAVLNTGYLLLWCNRVMFWQG